LFKVIFLFLLYIRKCNGTVAEINKIVTILNSAGRFPITNEVVIAVPALHLAWCRDNFRKDIAVSAEVRIAR
jgi:hypothetical protein